MLFGLAPTLGRLVVSGFDTRPAWCVDLKQASTISNAPGAEPCVLSSKQPLIHSRPHARLVAPCLKCPRCVASARTVADQFG